MFRGYHVPRSQSSFWEAETDGEVSHHESGLKGASRRLRLLRAATLPEAGDLQRARFCLLVGLRMLRERAPAEETPWAEWARKRLEGDSGFDPAPRPEHLDLDLNFVLSQAAWAWLNIGHPVSNLWNVSWRVRRLKLLPDEAAELAREAMRIP